MTYDEYQKNRHKTPYLLTIRAGSNFLYYFGERHSFNPEDTQWVEEKEFWDKFLSDTENQKRIVFVEGGKRPDEVDEKQSILKHGGMGLTTYFAHQAGIETYSPEPDEKWERSELEKEFTREQIQCYYFSRVVHQWGRKQNPKPVFEEYITHFLEGDKKESGWSDFDFSLESMKKIYVDIFHTAFNENNTDFFYSVVNPVELKTIVNKVSRASSEIRDKYIVGKIEEYIKQEYSIFAQYGCSHVVMQEPLLKEIFSESQKDWSDYYKATKAKPPRPLLVKAFEYVAEKNKAIDIGGGALNDTKYLLKQGFDVTVIDKSPLMEQEAKNIPSDRLHAFTVGFEDFDFLENEYDLASAMYALPFIDPAHFDSIFTKIKSSLKTGGIFCGQFFGERDEWSTNPKMTFHTKEQAENLLSDLEIISFKEEEKEDKTAKGDMKHWHIFHIIARKK